MPFPSLSLYVRQLTLNSWKWFLDVLYLFFYFLPISQTHPLLTFTGHFPSPQTPLAQIIKTFLQSSPDLQPGQTWQRQARNRPLCSNQDFLQKSPVHLHLDFIPIYVMTVSFPLMTIVGREYGLRSWMSPGSPERTLNPKSLFYTSKVPLLWITKPSAPEVCEKFARASSMSSMSYSSFLPRLCTEKSLD